MCREAPKESNMKYFDENKSRGERGSRRSEKPFRGNHSRDDREHGDNKDFRSRDKKFRKPTEGRSFDEDMRNPDSKKFSGKKVDKASKYYDAPDYQKKRGSNHRNFKSNEKNDRFRPKNYKEVDNFDEFDDSKFTTRRNFRSEKPKQVKKDNGETRLNKYIANAGVCSRREADTYIQAGVVTINGEVVTELGTRVKPGDEVRFGGEIINPERLVYILLNKPKNCVTTVDDPEERKTVMDLVKDACPERIYPVGRLDRNTTGLLLLTNDGELTKKLTHPSYEKKKIYQ
ncbi:MAG: rRNA pseudouridine synthase, partial [Bacteroidales bacterium]|nr:rRNA pseudouridine synthase [Bacteroidales bacterium]